MDDRERASRWLLAADKYFDGAPRPDADVVDVGAFTLFVSRTPWSYYARPAITHPRPLVRVDLEMLAEICLERRSALRLSGSTSFIRSWQTWLRGSGWRSPTTP